jgi:hypothetical protein
MDLIGIGDAVDAVAALQAPADVLSRVCEAVTAGVDDDGNVTGAQLLRIVWDEGVAIAAAPQQQPLDIAAAAPPCTVHRDGVHCRGAALIL